MGRLGYGEALELQRGIARDRISGAIPQDVLLLVEHPPVVTLGRAAKEKHLVASPEFLQSKGVEVFEVESLLTDVIDLLAILAFPSFHNRREKLDSGAFRHLLYPVRHLLDGLLVNLTTTDGAVGKAHARESQSTGSADE